MKKLLILSSLLLFLAQCATKKNTPPAWISAKPIDATGTYVYGVGMSYVNPNTSYQQAARSNALADLAQEVEGQIYDETRLLQKEDAGGFSTSLSSETLMRSHLKLEEYQLVESYSDGLRYYVLYRMDLPNFLIAKQEADQKALDWIQERLTLATSSDLPLATKWAMLGDATEKAIERNFLTDPSFAVKVKSDLIQAIRTVEGTMFGGFLLPESVFYLGMPAQFSAAFTFSNPELASHLKLTSSSGDFDYNSENQGIYCTATGKSNQITLTMQLELASLLPATDRTARIWLEERINWQVKSSINLQNTLVRIEAPERLKSTIIQSVSSLFSVDENAPLTISFLGEINTAAQSNNRYKTTIDGRFTLQNTTVDQTLWSSQRIEESALSTNLQAAENAALNTFAENINFFILPQLERSLGY